jgi:hypothetical protein
MYRVSYDWPSSIVYRPRFAGVRQEINGGRPPVDSRKSAAAGAGLSEHQRKTALRVASIPQEDFEKLSRANMRRQ